MKVFVKPNGVEVSVNAHSEEFARELGWIEKGAVPVEEQQESEAVEPRQKRKYTRKGS